MARAVPFDRMPPVRAQPSWPAALWIVRHGESAGNVAREAAESANAPLIDVSARDVDVPLSPRGHTQAASVGRWFAEAPEEARPTVVLASPYRRALETADHVAACLAAAGHEPVLEVDERLREKELGILNRLTKRGIVDKHPEEAERYAAIGKFYYRAPGGESWCDVVLRLRSVLDHVKLQYCGERVLVVAHQVVVLCFRYVLERLDEERVLAIDREGDVKNCSVTSYALEEHEGDPSRTRLALRAYNFVAPLEEQGAPVTAEPSGGGTAR